jgi:hypothetical protein
MTPASGVEVLYGFTSGKDAIDVNTLGQGLNFVRMWDVTYNGVHGISITNSANSSYGIILANVSTSLTASMLLSGHTAVGGAGGSQVYVS